jgi:hypothetical protein
MCGSLGALTCLAALLAGGCASTGADTGVEPLRAACSLTTNCFYQRNIRAYQPLDDNSVVVFVGPRRCPFLVTMDGFYCDARGGTAIAFLEFDGQICNLDRSLVATGPFVRQDNDCQIRDVEPLNDDELLETFAVYGIVEPPPATAPGELEVVEEEPPPAAKVPEEGATASAE